jgi:serine/threonine protein kinase
MKLCMQLITNSQGRMQRTLAWLIFSPGDLGRFIKKGIELKKAMPEPIIWKYFTQVCLGLQKLHQNRVLHRDIKPLNVFVGDNDVVKVHAPVHCPNILLFVSNRTRHIPFIVQIRVQG